MVTLKIILKKKVHSFGVLYLLWWQFNVWGLKVSIHQEGGVGDVCCDLFVFLLLILNVEVILCGKGIFFGAVLFVNFVWISIFFVLGKCLHFIFLRRWLMIFTKKKPYGVATLPFCIWDPKTSIPLSMFSLC
jgi:hypothetical protein